MVSGSGLRETDPGGGGTGGPGTGGAGQPQGGPEGQSQEDVVEADYEIVDEKK